MQIAKAVLVLVVAVLLAGCEMPDSYDRVNIEIRNAKNVSLHEVAFQTETLWIPVVSVSGNTLTVNHTGDHFEIGSMTCLKANHTFDLLGWNLAQRIQKGSKVCFNQTGLIPEDLLTGGLP